MPYISEEDREKFRESCLDSLLNEILETVDEVGKGGLNYVITKACLKYLERAGMCYDALSDVCGVLEDVVGEIRRRALFTYEDQKIIENGDLDEFERLLKK